MWYTISSRILSSVQNQKVRDIQASGNDIKLIEKYHSEWDNVILGVQKDLSEIKLILDDLRNRGALFKAPALYVQLADEVSNLWVLFDETVARGNPDAVNNIRTYIITNLRQYRITILEVIASKQ